MSDNEVSESLPQNNVALSNSLADLAVRIKIEHEATATALQRGAEHAMAAGDLLIEAKAQIKHGQWLPWLDKHCAMSERTAQLYMRMAKARREIEANTQHVADLSLRGAMAVIAPDEDEAAIAEGVRLANNVRAAAAAFLDAAREHLKNLRAFAEEYYASADPNERKAMFDVAAECAARHAGVEGHEEVRKMIGRWHRMNDKHIEQYLYYLSCEF